MPHLWPVAASTVFHPQDWPDLWSFNCAMSNNSAGNLASLQVFCRTCHKKWRTTQMGSIPTFKRRLFRGFPKHKWTVVGQIRHGRGHFW